MLAPITVVPDVLCADPALKQLVLDHCPAAARQLSFPLWLASPWTQMGIYQLNFKMRLDPIKYDRWTIPVGDDGDEIALDWHDGLTESENAPIAVMFTTLVGKNHDVVEQVHELRARGFRVVVLHRRGHDGLPLKSHTWNLMGDPQDVDIGIEEIHRIYPDAKIVLVGVSAGTGIVARYLAMKGESAPVSGAILLSPGWELVQNFNEMNFFISIFFAIAIKRHILCKHRDVLSSADRYWYAMLWCWTMASLYRNLYGVGGFKDFESFRAASDPIANMENISVPTLVINTHDDPACIWPEKHLWIFNENPYGILASVPHGGHLGCYEFVRGQSWMVELAGQFASAIVERKAA